MRFHYSAAALALITTATLAEECPAGYAKAKGIAWVDCDVKGENGSTLQCATIQVPKDWKNDSGPKMPLHLVRQPAKTKSSRGERSVIVNPGGPGASGIQTVVEGGESYQVTFGDDLHIVGFDPRGVGLTLPYTCGTENTKNKKTTRDVREIEDQTPYFNSNVDTADKCAAAQPDGDLIGTAYVARDVKAISESLGEDGLIRYVGYSYGTLLGATLAAMFPTKVDRIVLDGNINPQSYYHKLQTESAASTDDAFRHYFDLCAKAAKGNCAWAEDNKDGAQLTAKFDDFLATLTDEQSTVVRTKFFLMLYHPSQFKSFSSDLQGWKASPSMIPLRNAISDKDKRDKFEVKEYAKESTPEAISGIQCSDKITRFPYGSPENFKKWQEEYRAVTKYAYDTSGNNDLQCSVWKTTAKERFDVPQSGINTANHILFVNTAYDPVTPLISAVNSAKSFTKSLVLKSSGVGHCSNVNPSQALDDAVKEYMATGTLPKITEYKPDKENVFDEVEGDKANAPVKPTKRDFRYPAFFSKRDETAAAEQIPAGCTKIPMSSSALVSASASVVPSASAFASASIAVYSGSSIVYSSVSSSVVYPDASFYPSGSASVDYPQSSQYPSGSSAIIDYTRSSVTGSSSVGSYYAASTPVYSSGSSTSSTSSKTEPIHNHYPTSKPYASSAPIKSVDSKYPYSSSIPGHSSSIAPYPKGDDYAAGGDYPGGNAYTTGYYPVTISGKPKGPKTTSAPCATVAWSSQPGYVPITKTYTTTSVRTITKCPDTVKDCPLNLSTKTYITTEIKTRTTVVATPSSPPTSIKSYPTIKESDKESSAAPSKETGMVGQPSKQTKPITPSQPAKDTGYSSQPSKPTADSPQPPKETKTVQSTHSAYAPLKISSNPSVPTSVPPYPTGPSTPSSIKACNDMKCSYVAISTGTKPFTSTGASTTLKTTTPSVSVCFGNGCKATGTPTGYKPAEFTGAASSNFVSFMVGAGAIIVAFTCFF
ncbi:hypothetical protein N0V87_010490 [Didymella glomerata]|uniref:Peptidase S33 tripeptidyl aminopeptidase-like C-terminal domain-containing protein n=1 Tax=Didymella glomerata TaxID=749621 RepID=A0A9W8WP49_9PLEO|nr:hypothetical protein N0V87_010490 [Didymella glomerata]